MSHDAPTRSLTIALAVTGAIAVVELIGGWVFGSLALAADAVHMVSDTLALGIAVVAQRLAARPATSRHSFGWRRAEVLAAQLNGLGLVAVSVWIAVEAFDRLDQPSEIQGGGLLVVALVGLVANGYCTYLLHRTPGHNLNVRAAALHTLSDAASSVAVVVAAVFVLGGVTQADAVASLFVAALVAVAAVRLIADTTTVLLEAAPRSIDPDDVREALGANPSVTAVHHLHVWSLAGEEVALSAHVEMEGPVTLHEAQDEAQRMKTLLAERFGIRHATLELECHPCAPEEAAH